MCSLDGYPEKKGTGVEEDDYVVWGGVLGGPGIFEIVERINRLWDYYPLAEGSPVTFRSCSLRWGSSSWMLVHTRYQST